MADIKVVLDQIAILFPPVVIFAPAPLPTPTFPTPVLLSLSASLPRAVL